MPINCNMIKSMAHATALAQHILSLEPEKDAARLCFYNYLKNLCEATEFVNSELLNRFYFRALVFPFWQKNKDHLFNETALILQSFQKENLEILPVDSAIDPRSIQIIQVDNYRNFEFVVTKHLSSFLNSNEKLSTLPENHHNPSQLIAFVLHSDRTLNVKVFPLVAVLCDGEVSPLCHDFTLTYRSDLSLHSEIAHQLDLGNESSARFRVTHEGVFGTVVTGHMFQRSALLDGGNLRKYPALFYAIKRLEQFFVDRKTDLTYTELTALLEKAVDLLNERHPEAGKFAKAALERGRLAYDHIYSNDRLLQLLITNLEKTIALALNVQQTKVLRSVQAPPPGTFPIPIDSQDLKDEPWPRIRNLPV